MVSEGAVQPLKPLRDPPPHSFIDLISREKKKNIQQDCAVTLMSPRHSNKQTNK